MGKCNICRRRNRTPRSVYCSACGHALSVNRGRLRPWTKDNYYQPLDVDKAAVTFIRILAVQAYNRAEVEAIANSVWKIARLMAGRKPPEDLRIKTGD